MILQISRNERRRLWAGKGSFAQADGGGRNFFVRGAGQARTGAERARLVNQLAKRWCRCGRRADSARDSSSIKTGFSMTNFHVIEGEPRLREVYLQEDGQLEPRAYKQ